MNYNTLCLVIPSSLSLAGNALLRLCLRVIPSSLSLAGNALLRLCLQCWETLTNRLDRLYSSEKFDCNSSGTIAIIKIVLIIPSYQGRLICVTGLEKHSETQFPWLPFSKSRVAKDSQPVGIKDRSELAISGSI